MGRERPPGTCATRDHPENAAVCASRGPKGGVAPVLDFSPGRPSAASTATVTHSGRGRYPTGDVQHGRALSAQQGVVVRVAPEKAAWHGPNRGSDLCVSRRVRGDKLSGGSRGIPEELQLDELVDEASGDPRSDPGELDVLRCRCYQRQSSVTNGPTRAPSLATARHAGPPRGHRSAALTAKCLQLNQGQCLEASLAWANRTVTKLPR